MGICVKDHVQPFSQMDINTILVFYKWRSECIGFLELDLSLMFSITFICADQQCLACLGTPSLYILWERMAIGQYLKEIARLDLFCHDCNF